MHDTVVPCYTGRQEPWLQRLAWLPIPLLFVSLAALRTTQPSIDLACPPALLFMLDFVFCFLESMLVVFLLSRSFVLQSAPGLLLLGCGTMIWGVAGPVAAVVAGGDVNVSVTIYYSCVWISALCQLTGAWLSCRPRNAIAASVAWLAASYASGIGAVAVIALAVHTDSLPAFSSEGDGGSWLWQLVMGAAIGMFAGTAAVLRRAHRGQRSAFVHWYSLALLLVAVGLFGMTLETHRDDALSWTGRAAQYLGGLYMLFAAVASLQESRTRGTTIEAAFVDISERTRTEAALRMTNCRLGIVAEAASNLLAAREPLALVGHLCRKVMAHLDCDVFFNFVAGAEAHRLHLNAYAGIPAEQAKALEWLDFGEAVCGCVAARGQRIVAENVAATPDPRTELVKSLGINAYACHPLMSGERVIGTLSFGTRSRGRFSQEDLGMMKTVADLVAIAMERMQAQERLQESNRRKDEFLATMAHELRNPMAPIRNAAYVLKARVGGDQAVGGLCEIIERQIEHMARLVDDLLDLSRIERGKIELRKARVDVRTVVSGAIEVCRAFAESRRHVLTAALPDCALEVEGDPIRLEQAVCNLLDNACKYTPQQGAVRVTLTREGAEAVLRIRDNGIGVAPEALARVFEPFFQVDRSLSRSEGGLGIGLTLAQRLMHLHGGSITAASEGPGKGSEFVLRLPALDPAPARAQAAEQRVQVSSAAARKRQVLIIDDNEYVRESSEMLLATSGFRVSVAADGTHGLAQALALRPDIAIVDIGLPGLNGLEVAAGIRAAVGRDMFLIALSGYGGERDKALTAQAGFDLHLVKPVDPCELIAVLNAATREDPVAGAPVPAQRR